MPDVSESATTAAMPRNGIVPGSRVRVRDTEGEHEYTMVTRATAADASGSVSIGFPGGQGAPRTRARRAGTGRDSWRRPSADGRGCRRQHGIVRCGERLDMRGVRTKLLRTIAAEEKRRERDEKREERRRRRLHRGEPDGAASAPPAGDEMHDDRDAAPKAR
jgi:hypothetical protein